MFLPLRGWFRGCNGCNNVQALLDRYSVWIRGHGDRERAPFGPRENAKRRITCAASPDSLANSIQFLKLAPASLSRRSRVGASTAPLCGRQKPRVTPCGPPRWTRITCRELGQARSRTRSMPGTLWGPDSSLFRPCISSQKGTGPTDGHPPS